MPELFCLKTTDFELIIWSNDIRERQRVFKETQLKHKYRRAKLNKSLVLEPKNSLIYLSPALNVSHLKCEDETLEISKTTNYSEIKIPSHLFFENIQYQFEWVFLKDVSSAELVHKSEILNQGFRFKASHGVMPAKIIGTINTGNHVGRMHLPLEYRTNSQVFKHQLSFDILPTKIDLHTDLPMMYQEIDQVYPLWRFSFVEKTEQKVGKSQIRSDFPLIWLAHFSQLRERFEQGLNVIIQAPHSRLQAQHTYIKAERIKGRLRHKIGLNIKEDALSGNYTRRYKVDTKKLSVNTPENRFIKSVVSTCKKQLEMFEIVLRKSNQHSYTERLSDAFLNELHQWQQPLQKVLRQSFLKEVESFTDFNKDSLVLQQKTGYSTVYRVWQDLKFYMGVLGNVSDISMKSVAEIYEVWCFLILKNILQNELDFKPVEILKNKLILNEFFEYRLEDGFVGAFEFERSDGVTARLAHEPKFNKNGRDIRSYLVTQEPDIVLEITLPNRNRFIWIFDAKYRIKMKNNRFNYGCVDEVDYVPDDAINQMHRYRDALIHVSSESGCKSRPVFGAFALYPGYFDQHLMANPYQSGIDEVGIGAFALLPDNQDSTNGHYWLTQYLNAQIGKNSSDHLNKNTLVENLYFRESSRISITGMNQSLYPDLVIIVPELKQSGIHRNTFKNIDNRYPSQYLLSKKVLSNKYGIRLVEEIKFLALKFLNERDSNSESIEKIWPVKSVKLVTKDKVMVTESSEYDISEELYYFFDLGLPLLLENNVSRVLRGSIQNIVCFTTLESLNSSRNFENLRLVYSELINS